MEPVLLLPHSPNSLPSTPRFSAALSAPFGTRLPLQRSQPCTALHRNLILVSITQPLQDGFYHRFCTSTRYQGPQATDCKSCIKYTCLARLANAYQYYASLVALMETLSSAKNAGPQAIQLADVAAFAATLISIMKVS